MIPGSRDGFFEKIVGRVVMDEESFSSMGPGKGS